MCRLFLILFFMFFVPVFGGDSEALFSAIRWYYPGVVSRDARVISDCIVSESMAVGIDPFLVGAIIGVESRFDSRAMGRGGSAGLGQLMPGTYRRLGVSDPLCVSENVSATVLYLDAMFMEWMSSQYARRLAVASYHRGEMHYKRRGGKLDVSGRRYIAKVVREYERLSIF